MEIGSPLQSSWVLQETKYDQERVAHLDIWSLSDSNGISPCVTNTKGARLEPKSVKIFYRLFGFWTPTICWQLIGRVPVLDPSHQVFVLCSGWSPWTCQSWPRTRSLPAQSRCQISSEIAGWEKYVQKYNGTGRWWSSSSCSHSVSRSCPCQCQELSTVPGLVPACQISTFLLTLKSPLILLLFSIFHLVRTEFYIFFFFRAGQTTHCESFWRPPGVDRGWGTPVQQSGHWQEHWPSLHRCGQQALPALSKLGTHGRFE